MRSPCHANGLTNSTPGRNAQSLCRAQLSQACSPKFTHTNPRSPNFDKARYQRGFRKTAHPEAVHGDRARFKFTLAEKTFQTWYAPYIDHWVKRAYATPLRVAVLFSEVRDRPLPSPRPPALLSMQPVCVFPWCGTALANPGPARSNNRRFHPAISARMRAPAPESPMNVTDPISQHPEDPLWRDAMAAIRAGRRNGASYWDGIFGPLHAGQVDDLLVVGQIGQSLDGRAATATGHSHYINGAEGLDHLHRLRALMDAVVVGVGTVLADDPLLTVRRVAGPHPARVVIDPNGRLPAAARAFRDDGVRRLVIAAQGAPLPYPPPQAGEGRVGAGIERVVLPSAQGRLDPGD